MQTKACESGCSALDTDSYERSRFGMQDMWKNSFWRCKREEISGFGDGGAWADVSLQVRGHIPDCPG
jgi:hypothetical protein